MFQQIQDKLSDIQSNLSVQLQSLLRSYSPEGCSGNIPSHCTEGRELRGGGTAAWKYTLLLPTVTKQPHHFCGTMK